MPASEPKVFKLKAGGHTVGTGTGSKFLRANDPAPNDTTGSSGNLLRSHTDLAAEDPARWEEFKGEVPGWVVNQPDPAAPDVVGLPGTPEGDEIARLREENAKLRAAVGGNKPHNVRGAADHKAAATSHADEGKAAAGKPAHSPAKAAKPDYESMTKTELHALAEEKEIEVKKSATKEELIEALEGADK